MATNDLDYAREVLRDRVLRAMDRAAREIFGESISRNDAGATDGDLPRLFKALDEQLDVLARRYNHPLYGDGYIGSPKHLAELAELAELAGRGAHPVEDDSLR